MHSYSNQPRFIVYMDIGMSTVEGESTMHKKFREDRELYTT